MADRLSGHGGSAPPERSGRPAASGLVRTARTGLGLVAGLSLGVFTGLAGPGAAATPPASASRGAGLAAGPDLSWGKPVAADTATKTVVDAISCPGPNFCAAVDKSGNVVLYDAGKWSAPERIDTDAGREGLTWASCPTSGFCAAVDSDGGVLTYHSGKWSVRQQVDRHKLLPSMSCFAWA